MSAPPGEARVAVNKIIGRDPNWPGFIMLVNGLGAAELLDMVKCAIAHAPDDDTKAAWKDLAYQLTNAALGAIGS